MNRSSRDARTRIVAVAGPLRRMRSGSVVVGVAAGEELWEGVSGVGGVVSRRRQARRHRRQSHGAVSALWWILLALGTMRIE